MRQTLPGWNLAIHHSNHQKSSYQDLNGYQLYGFVDAGLAWNDGYRPSDGLHSP
jgi:hypothetical protein